MTISLCNQQDIVSNRKCSDQDCDYYRLLLNLAIFNQPLSNLDCI